MNYLNLLEYINDHKSRTDTIHGWEVVKTKHGHEREHERHGGELPGGHHEFMHKVIKKISGVKNPRSGEFMYHSAKHNQAAVLNVDHEKKQLRVITVLPKGKSTPKPGTQKFMIEGVEQDIEVVILEDTEFDELFEEFLRESNISINELYENTKLDNGKQERITAYHEHMSKLHSKVTPHSAEDAHHHLYASKAHFHAAAASRAVSDSPVGSKKHKEALDAYHENNSTVEMIERRLSKHGLNKIGKGFN